MRLPLTLAWLAASAMGTAHVHGRAANIDQDGYQQDGATTYCEGVNAAKGPLIFEHFLVKSAGKCPLRIAVHTTLTPSAAPGGTDVWVDWSVSLDSTTNLETSLFPRAVDAETGLPHNVIASLLRACKTGSNCATNSDVLVPAADVTQADDAASVGAFDAQGNKTLRRFVFGVAGAGDFVVVAKIVLPGDPQLNISATEFVAFKRVRVGVVAGAGTAETQLPGTVKPAGEEETSDSGTVGSVATTVPAKPVTAAPRSVEAQEAADGAVTGANPTRSGTTNIIVLSSIAGLGFIIAVIYFATAKKHHGTIDDDVSNVADHGSADAASIYRLTDAAKRAAAAAPAAMPQGRQVTTQPPRRFQSRQPTQMPWQAMPAPVMPGPASITGPITMAHPASTRRQMPVRTFPDADVQSLTVSAQAEPSSSQDSRCDLLASQLTSFNSLHDSAITLPIKSRHRRTSSASSYADDLDDSDQEEFAADASGASRLFTETHISEVLHHHHHQYHDPQSVRPTSATAADDRSTQQSTYSWLQSEDRDSDLGVLTTAIHERYSRQ